MLEIRPVFQAGIDLIWPLIKEGLDRIEAKGMVEEPQEWIRQMLKTTPFMMAYLLYEGNEYAGFILAKLDAKIHHQEFCIYKAFKLNGHDTDGLMDRIKDIARANKCSKITFYSTRKGWKKAAEKYGFSEGYVQYTQEV